MTDLLDRLSRANPVPVPDDPALPEVPAARQHRGAAISLIVVAAGVLLAWIALGPMQRRSGHNLLAGPGVAEAAVATLNPRDQLLHVVTATRELVDGRVVQRRRIDDWIAPRTSLVRTRIREANGRIVQDVRMRPLPGRPLIADPVSAARSMLEKGRLRPAGAARIRGRRVRRFIYIGRGVEFFFDRQTSAPVRIVMHAPGQRRAVFITDFLSYERLPDTAASRRFLKPRSTRR